MSDPTQPTRRASPQWTNSYESQLSDEKLRWLHACLLARSPSDKELIDLLPPWRDGPRKGQPVSKATLSNIRDRLEMEEDFREDESTTESLLNQVKSEVESISEEQLEALGNKTFTLLSLRKRDPKTFLKIRSARNKAELERQKLALAERAESRQVEALALEKQKFMQATAEKILDETLRQRASEIAGSNVSHAEKIEQLGRAMFGEDWK